MKLFLFLMILLLPGFVISQQDFDFYGLISLRGDKSKSISYRLVFQEKNGLIHGYSITDISGEHETKNIISGSLNKNNNTLIFSEQEIVYTKSTVNENSFCFINYSGKIKLKSASFAIDGNFKGLMNNKSSCIDGTIQLVSIGKINSFLQKMDKKIQTSKKLDQKTKENVKPKVFFDSITTNQLINGQNLSIFETKAQVNIDIWDNEIEDGDQVSLFINNKEFIQKIEITKVKQTIKIPIDSTITEVRIKALNTGRSGLNTASLEYQGNKTIDLKTHLKTGESAAIVIRK